MLRIHSFGHVGVSCRSHLTSVYGFFVCARTIPLYGAIARARSLISNRCDVQMKIIYCYEDTLLGGREPESAHWGIECFEIIRRVET